MCYDVVSNTALLTCLTCFTSTSHPVHCVPLLTPTLFRFQNERKGSKGNALFPIWALSYGIKSHTLYAMLQQNHSSKLNSKPHCSSQPMDQPPKFLSFPLPIIPALPSCCLVCIVESSPPYLPVVSSVSLNHPRPTFLLSRLYRWIIPALPSCCPVCIVESSPPYLPVVSSVSLNHSRPTFLLSRLYRWIIPALPSCCLVCIVACILWLRLCLCLRVCVCMHASARVCARKWVHVYLVKFDFTL